TDVLLRGDRLRRQRIRERLLERSQHDRRCRRGGHRSDGRPPRQSLKQSSDVARSFSCALRFVFASPASLHALESQSKWSSTGSPPSRRTFATERGRFADLQASPSSPS